MRAPKLALGLGIGAVLVGLVPPSLHAGELTRREKLVVGKELFFREWVADDPRARGGDGLGPLYNASSCVACHFLGGPGGAGTNSHDAEIAIASVRLNKDEDPEKVPRDELIKAHPGFRDGSGVILHAHGVYGTYDRWRDHLLASEHGRFRVTVTKRNTPALFGAGHIDAIPEPEIRRMAARSHPEAPEVQGRLSLLANGKIGRFGWKGQTASLDDFVRTACAVELGLEVPGHPQSPSPDDRDARAPGLDLSDAECSSLAAFVGSLRKPGVRDPFNSAQAQAEQGGRQLFASVGCAACHSPSVGELDGLYSDLLLHDMGIALVDSGAITRRPPTSQRPRRGTWRPRGSGGPRPCGACATRGPTCTTVAQLPSKPPSSPTAARQG